MKPKFKKGDHVVDTTACEKIIYGYIDSIIDPHKERNINTPAYMMVWSRTIEGLIENKRSQPTTFLVRFVDEVCRPFNKKEKEQLLIHSI